MTFNITVIDTVERKFAVEAESEEDARQMLEDQATADLDEYSDDLIERHITTVEAMEGDEAE